MLNNEYYKQKEQDLINSAINGNTEAVTTILTESAAEISNSVKGWALAAAAKNGHTA